MSSLATNLPPATLDPEEWIRQYQSSRPPARPFEDFYGDILRQHGFDPEHLPQRGDPNYNAFWANDSLYRTQASSAFERSQRAGSGSFFAPGVGVTGNQANFLQDLFLGYDAPRIQHAADVQHEDVSRAIGTLQQDVQQGAENIRISGNEGAQELRTLAGTVGRAPMEFATSAVTNAEENVRRADELAGVGTQSAVAGYEQSVRNQLALMRAGTNPDGSPMTAEQLAATQSRIIYDSRAAAGQIRSQYDQIALTTRANLSSVQEAAAGTALNVGQLEGALTQQAGAIQTSAMLSAAQLEAQGDHAAAQLILANPHSIVSVSNGLLNMWGVFLGGTPAPHPNNIGSILGGLGGLLGGIVGLGGLIGRL